MTQYQKAPARRGIMQSLGFNILLMIGVCIALYFIFFASLGLITHHGEQIKVPNVTGKNVRAAVQTLEGMGFEVKVDSMYDPTQKALIVLLQMPEIGETVKTGRTLFLTVNKSTPPLTAMPKLVDLSFRSAALILQSQRLVLGDTTYRPDIVKDGILEQLYNGQPIRPGTMIPQGSRISLVIGNGLGNTELAVPDVIGMTVAEAVAILSSNNLMVVPVYDADVRDTANAKIYRQTPNAISDLGVPSMIRAGDGIDIYIGQAPTDSLMDHYRNLWKENLKTDEPNETL
jgi:beta-lactam-binding protein with PASTA domain